MDAIIHTGNVLDILPTLPSNSVQCCVTSPPYWGLRDYGTGTWEGGDPACDHKPTDPHKRPELTGGCATWSTRDVTAKASGECSRCGARRIDQQLGSEPTPEAFVDNLVAVFREVRRVLRDDGTLWLNLGDSYAGNNNGYSGDDRPSNHNGKSLSSTSSGQTANGQVRRMGDGLKPKDLCGIPWRVAFALQADGWWLRSDIIWAKPNPMPESVTDRPTKAHEYVFLLTKSARYFYDAEAVKEQNADPQWTENALFNPTWSRKSDAKIDESRCDSAAFAAGQKYSLAKSTGRNLRTVWTIATQPYSEAHFATFPEKLVEPMILAGTSAHGACPECGAPWQRVVEREANPMGINGGEHRETHRNGALGKRQRDAERENRIGQTATLGFAPTCTCGCTETVPCVVLDPFTGSGTTGAVAVNLGRAFVGCELNPAYVKLAEKRIGHAQPALFGI